MGILKKLLTTLAIVTFMILFTAPREARSVTAIEYGLIAATVGDGPSIVTCAPGQQVEYVIKYGDGSSLFPEVLITDQEYTDAVDVEVEAILGVKVKTVIVPVAAIGALTAMGGSLNVEINCADILHSL